MAYAYRDGRRILVPTAPGTPIFPHPPPPPPPPFPLVTTSPMISPPNPRPAAPAGFFVSPGNSVVLRGPFHNAFLVQNNVLVPMEPPRMIGVDSPAPPRPPPLPGLILMRVDELRTLSLLKLLADEGLVPSPQEEWKRECTIAQLKEIVLSWIKKVACRNRLPSEVVASTSATIFTFGSYGLGVHGTESDIDAICVAPQFATLEEDFFNLLFNMLEKRPEVSELQCVKSAKVPLMRFKFNGISIDFPYAQLPIVTVSDTLNIFDPALSKMIDETSWRSLSGVRTNKCILELVPNLKNFRCLLRCLKLWAKRRGLYGHLFGFFGGIHLAILSAYICQKHPNASVAALMELFFGTFSQWPWPEPVILYGQSIPYRKSDRHLFMPIMMPCSPYEWCNSNITRSTYRKIISELHRGFSLIKFQDVMRMDFWWSQLFEAFPYSAKYDCFLRILLVAPNVENLKDWVGWVKSRLRGLLLKVEALRLHCDPDPTEYIDYTLVEANTVFYWGLFSCGTTVGIKSLQEGFLRWVYVDSYTEEKGNQCRLQLSIIEPSQLPENLIHGTGSKLRANCSVMDPGY